MADREPRTRFTRMVDSTRTDWKLIDEVSIPFNHALADRVIDHLKLLQGEYGGFAIDRLEHSLQSASLAHRDGKDEEYVVCALLHDIGDTLASHNHAELAATILEPFVSAENHWLLKHHGIFQGYYFFHHVGLNRDMREQFRAHPCFERTALFCERHDQNAFDPKYPNMALDAFVPLVRRVMARPKRSIYLPEDGKNVSEALPA